MLNHTVSAEVFQTSWSTQRAFGFLILELLSLRLPLVGACIEKVTGNMVINDATFSIL